MARSDPHEQAIRSLDHKAIERVRKPSGDPLARRAQSALPADAVAIIEAPSRPVTQSGAARLREWRLRFQPRHPPFVDPLTGWTGSEDPLAHVAIRFPSREAAVGFAKRHGLAFQVREPSPRRAKPVAKESDERLSFQLCCWPTGPHALCCGDFPALKETMR